MNGFIDNIINNIIWIIIIWGIFLLSIQILKQMYIRIVDQYKVKRKERKELDKIFKILSLGREERS